MRKALSNYDIFGVWPKNGPYSHMICPQLSILNISRLKNPHEICFKAFYDKSGNFFDVGQKTRDYVLNNSLNCKVLDRIFSIFSSEQYGLLEEINPKYDLGSQLINKDYSSAEVKLIKDIFEASTRSPGGTKYDLDIGFFENNIFLDYKHGSAWSNPDAGTINIKDKIINDFIDSILQ